MSIPSGPDKQQLFRGDPFIGPEDAPYDAQNPLVPPGPTTNIFPSMSDNLSDALQAKLEDQGSFIHNVWYCSDPRTPISYVICSGKPEFDYKMIKKIGNMTVSELWFNKIETIRTIPLPLYTGMGTICEMIATLHSRIQDCEQVDLQCYKNH